MDMDFMGKKRSPIQKSTAKKELPGFRASSELPQNSEADQATLVISEDELASAFSSESASTVLPGTDPTDLTLDRDKNEDKSIEGSDMKRPFAKAPRLKTKKKHIVILLIILGIVAASAAGWLVSQRLMDKKDQEGEVQTVNAEQKVEPEAPKTVASPMTGLEVSPEIAKKQVTAIMIENGVDARPQAGLLQADMVFEAVAEGGITRFVSLYQDSSPDHVGPIRSARPYYVEIAKTFDAAFVHAGGSDDGLAKINELDVKDMSAFEENGTYTRINYRAAPHNLYSSIEKLNARQTALGYTSSSYTPWKRKNDSAQTPSMSTITFSVSSPLYNPSFTYDATTNSYLRSQNGEAHTDEKSGKQINPKVVLAIVTAKGQQGIYSTYRTTGSGEIRVFQDGIVSEGTWAKESSTAPFVFKDKNGLEFNFNKGQIWTTFLGSTGNITTAP